MKSFISSIIIFLSFIGHSQIPEIKWQQCFGTNDDFDYTWSMEKSMTGYLISMQIETNEPGINNYHGSVDGWIISIDNTGNMIWNRCYGGSMGDNITKVEYVSDDEYYLFGTTASTDGDVQSYNHGNGDLWVVNINNQGMINWEKCFGGPGPEEPRDLIHTPDGGFIILSRIHIAGGDVSQYYGSWDVWMCKCDSLGNIEWEKTLGNQWLDSGMSLIINSEGNTVIIGAAAHSGGIVECTADDGYGDVWLVELDMSGNILWQRCYGGSFYELGYVISELDDGYIFAVSSTSNDGDVTGHHGPGGLPPDGWSDIWVVRINDQGEIIWQNSLGGYADDIPYFIDHTLDEGFIIFGNTISNNGDVSGNHTMPGSYGDNDIWMAKLSSEGELEWQKCFGGWGDDRFFSPHSVIKISDYNYVLASVTDFKSGNDDIQCDIHAENDYDAWIFEIDSLDTTGVTENNINQELVKVYPNPAKEYIVIETSPFNPFCLRPPSQEGNYVLITNVFGQGIAKLIIKSEKTVWDCREVDAGIYFYQITFNNETISGKMIIQ